MKPYYGSNTIIEQIDLSRCKPYKDFRQGFYLAEIREQVEQMVNIIFLLFCQVVLKNIFTFSK